MSTTTSEDRRRELIPDRFRELLFVAVAIFGVAVFAVGMVQVILGLSLGFRDRAVLAPPERLLLTVAGLGLVIRGLTLRVRVFQDAFEWDERISRLVGEAVVVPAVVGVMFGAAVAAAGTIEGLPVSFRFLWVIAVLYGFVVSAVVNGLVTVVSVAVGPPLARVIDGVVDELRASDASPWIQETLDILADWLDNLMANLTTAMLLVGVFALFLGMGTQTARSAPFLMSLVDKVVLLGGGLVSMWLGWKLLRFAGRVVGW